MNTAILTGAMVAAFAAIHILVGRLRFLDGTPRSRWLSFAGGVAVAFVFLHVLPDLAAHQGEFAEGLRVSEVFAESVVNALALTGLVVFYGLERAVKLSRAASQESGEGDRTQDNVQYLHLVAYGAFNVLVGYLLLHREDMSGWGLALFFVAMALHFVTADFGMRQDNPHSYEKVGRWVIAAAVVAGWALGIVTQVREVLLGCLFAFLAGGIVLMVLKEELPEERQSFFLPFLAGTILYAALVFAERHWAA